MKKPSLSRDERLKAIVVERLKHNGDKPFTEEEMAIVCGDEMDDVSDEIIQTLYAAAKPQDLNELTQFLERFDQWIERRRRIKEDTSANT
jgi:hypothetical protein